jgi:hypothetical protein
MAPRVPTLQPGQIQTSRLPDARIGQVGIGQVDTPYLRFQPHPYASELGQTISNVAVGLYQQHQKMRANEDAARVRTAETELLGTFQQYLNNPQTGVLNTVRGEQAFTLPDDASEFGRKAYSEISAKLQPRQRGMFLELAQRHIENFQVDVLRHTNKEIETYKHATYEAKLDLEAAEALRNVQDPVRLARGFVAINSEIERYGEENGRGQDWIRAETAKATSALWAASIKQLLADGNTALAKAYFVTAQDKILGDDRNILAVAVDRGVTESTAVLEADRIRVQFPFGAEGVTQTTWMNEAAKIQKADVRKEAESRLRQYWQVHQDDASDRARSQASVAKAAVDDWLRAAANRIDAGLAEDALKTLPGWADMPDNVRKDAIAYAKAVQAGPEKIKTNWGTYFTLMRVAANPESQEEFAKANLMGVRGELADPEFKQLVEIQSAILKRDTTKSNELLSDWRTEEEVVRETLRPAGLYPTETSPDAEKERYKVLRRKLGERVVEIQRRTNRKASNDEIQDALDQLVIEYFTSAPGAPGSVSKRGMEMTIEDMVPEDLRMIDRLLQSQGYPITDDNRIRLYQEWLSSPQGKARSKEQ